MEGGRGRGRPTFEWLKGRKRVYYEGDGTAGAEVRCQDREQWKRFVNGVPAGMSV